MNEFRPKYRMLTQQEVSQWLGIPVATLASKRSRPGRNPIPFVRIGNRVRYNERDVLAWIEQNTFDKAEDALRAG